MHLLKAQILLQLHVTASDHKLKLKQNSSCVLVKTKGFVSPSVFVCSFVSGGPCSVCVSWDLSVLFEVSARRWNTGLHSETLVTRAEVTAVERDRSFVRIVQAIFVKIF